MEALSTDHERYESNFATITSALHELIHAHNVNGKTMREGLNHLKDEMKTHRSAINALSSNCNEDFNMLIGRSNVLETNIARLCETVTSIKDQSDQIFPLLINKITSLELVINRISVQLDAMMVEAESPISSPTLQNISLDELKRQINNTARSATYHKGKNEIKYRDLQDKLATLRAELKARKS